MVESVQNIVFAIGKSSSSEITLCKFMATVAAVSSSLGIVTTFKGVTRDFPIKRVQYIVPLSSLIRIYDAAPYPDSEASAK